MNIETVAARLTDILINGIGVKIKVAYVLMFGTVCAIIGGGALLVFKLWLPENKEVQTLGIIFSAIAAGSAYLIGTAKNAIDEQEKRIEIAAVQTLVHDNPQKPQFAWDLARIKLESYLDRNLSHVRLIFWLTSIVMLCGFGFVLYGLYKAFSDPLALPTSIVASASGVLISFIGGSLLLIYRSIMAQSKGYVTVLERINAVGMAVQVIESIPDENSELKNLSKADLAKQLLTLYGNSAPK